jgi:hypothetical protein
MKRIANFFFETAERKDVYVKQNASVFINYLKPINNTIQHNTTQYNTMQYNTLVFIVMVWQSSAHRAGSQSGPA